MDAILAGVEQTISAESQQQRVVPGVTFTCHGFITKWILAASLAQFRDSYPELQTWNSSDGTTYTKQRATRFNLAGGSAEETFYECTPDTPHEFYDGEVLGIFIPGDEKTRYNVLFESGGDLPLSYYETFSGSGSTLTDTPLEGDFTTTAQGVLTANEVPLMAVEVCKLQCSRSDL